jgi:NADPH-dependent ferric siderophore reductase
MNQTGDTTPDTRGVRRVRHETRMRMLHVVRTQRLTPTLLRITLGGRDLAGFTSAAADDHVKVFFPLQPGGQPIVPAGPPGARTEGSGPAPVARDYTPRRFDPTRLELDLEFSLHGEGPAARWAAQAVQGHELAIGGPRGSFVLQGEFDWYLLVGDETALPAIARRLEELPPGARAFVIAEIDDAANQLALTSAAMLQVQWVHRNGAAAGADALLSAALAKFSLPPGVGYTWIAAESNVARSLRSQLLARGHDKRWLKAAGYWKHGASATHDKLDD